MKKFFPVFLILVVMGVATYFGVTKIIIPYANKLQYYHYIIVGAIVLLLVLLGVSVTVFFYRNKDKKIRQLSTRLKQWTNLSVHVNHAGDAVFRYLPIAILIYDNDLKIIWVNNYAKEVFREDLIDRPLSDLNLGLALYIKDKTNNNNVIEISGKFYHIEQRDDESIIYLFDATSEELTKQKYERKMRAVANITIDNLEMETKKLDMQESATIHGDILGEISEWASRFNGYLQEKDDDELILLVDQEHLRQMMEDKFSILDQVRERAAKSKVRVTLSIGVASGDVDYKELGRYAEQAIDLAKKRGGDQAVVNIIGEKISYYGAKSNALAKNDLLAARSNTLALKDFIEAAGVVYIMAHAKADADAIGACIGCLKLVLSSNKEAHVVMDYYKVDPTAQKMLQIIQNEEAELFEFFVNDDMIGEVPSDALLIVVDTQSPKIAMNESLIYKFKKVAVIDHHRSSDDGYSDPIFSYVEPYASSTVELITEMFQFYQKDGVKITPLEATLMLAGLVVDTNNFTFRTSTRTFEVASYLKDAGANMIEIRKMLREDLKFRVDLATHLKHSEIFMDKFAICTFDQDDIVQDRTILAKVAESLLDVDNVEAAFVIANYEEDTREGVAVSARSYGGDLGKNANEQINVQVVMEEMGGGGHLNSAATQISNTTINATKEKLMEILRRDYEKGEKLMKVILLEKVEGHGDKNEIVDVATGYGNFLISNKRAKLATDQAIQELQEELRQAKIAEEEQRKVFMQIKQDIEAKSVNIYIRVGVDGKLYGHVTTKQICEEFEAQTGIHIDKKKVYLPIEITQLGNYQAVVELNKDIKAQFDINVLEK